MKARKIVGALLLCAASHMAVERDGAMTALGDIQSARDTNLDPRATHVVKQIRRYVFELDGVPVRAFASFSIDYRLSQ